ncbi:hypothetical protein LOTGIDRAFT_169887 [Lottia gigantea]|uniref:Uncharacterized protein n=1 Tax=Lottia gigantea TaxID=225164 RepID=V3ZEP4_LOTGI|nr:hypothetical protein LOTGIDRAFT_169887 [Lottia gigantea]ESO82567.1 hypothetical protein LOTGIDRAFT_169887 [Lottia gigantea]
MTSFIAAIGHLMINSGLSEVLCQVYGENAVLKMMNGKSYARTIRGLFSVDTCLNAMLLSRCRNLNLTDTVCDIELDQDLKDTMLLLDKLLKGDIHVNEITAADGLRKIATDLNKEKSLLNHKTSDLWLQMMSMIESGRLFFRSEGKNSRYKWDIGTLRNGLGEEMCEILPLLHVLTGCNTVSRIFEIGKGMVLKKAVKSEYFRNICKLFLKRDSTKAEVMAAGETVLVAVYGGLKYETLNELRYRKFREKVYTSNSQVTIECLPPTSDSAKYHVMRVYHQVQCWKDNHLSSNEWGWTLLHQRYKAIKMKLPPAPDSLLQMIRCSCKGDVHVKRMD